MAILATAKISRDFRVTIPKEVRDMLELDAGDELVFFTVAGSKGRVCFRKSGH
ncbi:AbrB/MazE/SpoVT family DNA-binding domain-containing protein [Candidatus Bathyarchaeota archaeon]|nr:MAG: AbrB/MazE/SpoVT family DNA-binding domain-containing protein [Candidatus Bathyarchaeota archaeon]